MPLRLNLRTMPSPAIFLEFSRTCSIILATSLSSFTSLRDFRRMPPPTHKILRNLISRRQSKLIPLIRSQPIQMSFLAMSFTRGKYLTISLCLSKPESRSMVTKTACGSTSNLISPCYLPLQCAFYCTRRPCTAFIYLSSMKKLLSFIPDRHLEMCISYLLAKALVAGSFSVFYLLPRMASLTPTKNVKCSQTKCFLTSVLRNNH